MCALDVLNSCYFKQIKTYLIVINFDFHVGRYPRWVCTVAYCHNPSSWIFYVGPYQSFLDEEVVYLERSGVD